MFHLNSIQFNSQVIKFIHLYFFLKSLNDEKSWLINNSFNSFNYLIINFDLL